MPNSNYLAGRRFEYERKKYYERVLKCEVMRTAGSHGLFDLIVISPDGDVSFLQLKRTEDKATAKRMLNAFKARPPLGHRTRAKYHQVMEVKVLPKGTKKSEVLSVTV
jgi:hypothetical protein